MTFRVVMYEVRGHIGGVTINLFFAGMMEMNLLQRIDFVTDREPAAGRIVDLDGVAVVDDIQRHSLVIKLQGGKVRGRSALDID